jgi:hypothetical protein
MDRVDVGRYENPAQVGGWLGWVTGDDWIMFHHGDGTVWLSKTAGRGQGVIGEPIILV